MSVKLANLVITSLFFTFGQMWPDSYSSFFNPWTTDVRSLNDIIITKTDCSQCPQVYLPVCGTNNKTFTNECFIKCLNYKNRNSNKFINVTKYRMGPCDVFGTSGSLF